MAAAATANQAKATNAIEPANQFREEIVGIEFLDEQLHERA